MYPLFNLRLIIYLSSMATIITSTKPAPWQPAVTPAPWQVTILNLSTGNHPEQPFIARQKTCFHASKPYSNQVIHVQYQCSMATGLVLITTGCHGAGLVLVTTGCHGAGLVLVTAGCHGAGQLVVEQYL